MSIPIEIVIAGGGGHASVVIDLLYANGTQVKGYIGPELSTSIAGCCPYLGSDEMLARFDQNLVRLANGIGALKFCGRRKAFYNTAKSEGFSIPLIMHPAATLASTVNLGEGVQVMAGAIVNPFAVVGENTILNTRCVIEHHAHVGRHSHIAPGAVICGEAVIGDGVFIGAGATIVQGVRVGDGAFVAAGAVVINDIDPDTAVKGVPAR